MKLFVRRGERILTRKWPGTKVGIIWNQWTHSWNLISLWDLHVHLTQLTVAIRHLYKGAMDF